MARNNPSRKLQVDILMFILAAAFIAFCLGVAVGNYKFFPYGVFRTAGEAADEIELYLQQAGLLSKRKSEVKSRLFFHPINPPFPPAVLDTDEAKPGINLVTRMDGIKVVAEVLDMEGNQLHEWDVRWSRVWPDAHHIPKKLVPKSEFGAPVHGAILLENGDIIFNYEHLGLVRMAKDGEVLWRLPYRTHHSVKLAASGNLWVCGQKQFHRKDPNFPFRPKSADKYSILEVSQDGQILRKWFIADILHDNGYDGLLHLNSILPSAFAKPVQDDRLHLNDVEPFPDSFEEGFFRKGDVLVSLRNVNTVFVFNADTGKIRYISTGLFVNQHDPDFIDGNRFSVFDNNNRQGKGKDALRYSRIVIVSPADSTIEVFYEGSPEAPFYSDIMGNHQWLENGHLLVVESTGGRAFEINKRGQIVWQYYNYTGEGVVSTLQGLRRYPLNYGGFSQGKTNGDNTP